MTLQSDRPSLTMAQLAFQATADLEAAHYVAMKLMFQDQIVLYPLSGVNRFGFTQAQMLSGLGADQTEFVNFYKALLLAIATVMPSFPSDTWAAQTNIRPWFAVLGVTIPNGF